MTKEKQKEIVDNQFRWLENRIGRTLSPKEVEHVKIALFNSITEAIAEVEVIQP